MLYGLAIVLIPLFLGYLFKLKNHRYLAIVNKVVNTCLYLILLVMGISLGQIDNILTELPQIGGTAFSLVAILLLSNIVGLVIYDKIQPMQREQVSQDQLPSRLHLLLDSATLIGATLFGGLVGYFTKGMVDFPLHSSTYILEIMIFGVGIQLRNSGIPLREVFFNKRGIYTSIVMVVSSLVGGVISAFLLDLSLAKGLTFASAFGWYSLSSVLVNDAWGPIYGSIAFFNDISREILCLFLVPLFMRQFPSTSVGIGGATSLDCMLPIIQKSGGIQIVPLAISFGFIVNLAAPLLLAIFIGLEG
ncbi:lysine exporter LysO family protein [Mannheimia sp. AT1]|uniref:Lysine exporter LysO family protein n=1 Tax=Mannheimia cairinae TaxID=3025936 RepID=A0ABT5MP62_9PAST|nr:lysine exporter LysO family protein [Mannheimia cairinae]MDD0823954.1 lysine exporter LysO family protein [Mannheimia cairinae]MDD0825270.1 lysine exporter LysO family protein [Mannheimia cairinae]